MISLRQMAVRKPSFVLIDISNSFTKIAYADREAIGSVKKVPTPKLTCESLAAALAPAPGRTAPKYVVLSSVVPEAEERIRPCLAQLGLIRVGPDINLGVGIDYPQPRTIGADRLANAASAVAFYGAPVVVVDFGTAVTFDIISSQRTYVGGVIAPGLEAMTDYLYQRTALLPRINLLEPVSAIGKSTKSAMLAGAVFGYRGLVKQIISEIKQELGARRLKVVATGGYAELIAAKMP